MTITELYELAKDRPNSTIELHTPNDFYGHAAVLKQYAKFPSNYRIKAAIEHGPIIIDEYVWDSDINSPLPRS